MTILIDSRFITENGGAGSGKSYYICTKLIIKALRSKRRILVCRKSGTTLKDSVMQLFKEILIKFKIIDKCNISDYNKLYELPNGSQIIFKALDEETKLLSIQDISDIWVEETFEVEKNIFDQLNTRLRGSAGNLQLYCSYNPISQSHWLYDFTIVNPPDNAYVKKTIYKDNKFLPKSVVQAYEDQGRRNPKWKRVYLDGEFGVNVDDLVLPNHKIEPFDTNILLQDKSLKLYVGMDTGVVDDTALVVSLHDAKNAIIYVIDEFHGKGFTLDDIYDRIVEHRLTKCKIVVDSADLRAINFLKSKRINCVGCTKGKGSVEAGYSYLQNHTIIVHPTCKYTADSLDNLVYLRDKKTNELTENMDHSWSHAIDGLRYPYSEIYKPRSGSINKALFVGL